MAFCMWAAISLGFAPWWSINSIATRAVVGGHKDVDAGKGRHHLAFQLKSQILGPGERHGLVMVQHVLGQDESGFDQRGEIVALQSGLSRPSCSNYWVNPPEVTESNPVGHGHPVQPQSEHGEAYVGRFGPEWNAGVLNDIGTQSREYG
jgi:hypothetical protein